MFAPLLPGYSSLQNTNTGAADKAEKKSTKRERSDLDVGRKTGLTRGDLRIRRLHCLSSSLSLISLSPLSLPFLLTFSLPLSDFLSLSSL